MEIHRTEGVILQAHDFKDYDQILTLFTTNRGLLKLVYKGGKSIRRRGGNVTSPLTRAEIIYVEGKSDLHRCRDISTLNHYLELRQSIESIQAGCELMRSLLRSQLVEKPSPLLYQLFLSYLDQLTHYIEPRILVASFQLKILRHDGLLGDEEPFFSDDEKDLVHSLAFCRSFKELKSLSFNLEFNQKVERFFLMRI